MKARLLVTYDCLKDCEGCCNKLWKGNPPQVIESFDGYEEILITGGEPLLFPYKLWDLIDEIRKISKAKIYVYTSAGKNPVALMKTIKKSNGICLTLHDKKDADDFYAFLRIYAGFDFSGKSLRLNIFKGIGMPEITNWKIKRNVEWLENCPLPEGEVFLRLKEPWKL